MLCIRYTEEFAESLMIHKAGTDNLLHDATKVREATTCTEFLLDCALNDSAVSRSAGLSARPLDAIALVGLGLPRRQD